VARCRRSETDAFFRSLLSGRDLQDGRVLFQDAERDSFHVLTQLSVALLFRV